MTTDWPKDIVDKFKHWCRNGDPYPPKGFLAWRDGVSYVDYRVNPELYDAHIMFPYKTSQYIEGDALYNIFGAHPNVWLFIMIAIVIASAIIASGSR